jgi:PKD repeat protein
MDVKELLESKKLKISVVIIIVIIILISLSVIILGAINNEDITENEYEMNYVTDGIVISQTSGKVINEKLNVSINYNDGYVLEENVTLSNEGDNSYIALDKRDSNYVESIELYTMDSGEKTILSNLGPQFTGIDDFSISDFSLSYNETFKISASDYVSNENEVSSYSWEFSDNVTLEGETIVRDLSEEQYSVILLVTDKYGNTNSDTFNITVDGNSNTLTSKPYIKSSVGEKVHFSGEESVSDIEQDIVSYTWNFDDGNIKEGNNVVHSFSDNGVYNVTLLLEDVNGNKHANNINIIISSEIVSEFNVENKNGFDYTFNASESKFTDDVGEITYYWTFGDGNTKTTDKPRVNYTYSSPSTYDVSLVIGSENGFESTSKTTVNPSVYLDFADELPYRVIKVNEGYEDVIMPNHELGDNWPEIIFVDGARYEFRNLPSDIEFVDNDDNVLLSQYEDGSMEDAEDINWIDNENSVEFTITEELGEKLYGYQTYE